MFTIDVEQMNVLIAQLLQQSCSMFLESDAGDGRSGGSWQQKLAVEARLAAPVVCRPVRPGARKFNNLYQTSLAGRSD